MPALKALSGKARYANTERACGEFNSELMDATWDSAKNFDAIHRVARAKGIEVNF